MRRSGFFVAISMLALAVTATARSRGEGDDDKPIPLSDCPEAVRKTFQAESQGAKIATVNKETDGDRTTYWADIDIGGKPYEIGVAQDGTLVELSLEVGEDEVAFSECPHAVQATFRRETRDTKIDSVSKDLRYGGIVYETSVNLSGKAYGVVVGEDGTLIEKVLTISEEEIELAKCPEAVQKTLQDQSQGGKIGTIVRSTGIGGHVFESDVDIHGKSYVLEVKEDGRLISKSLDEGDKDNEP